MDPETAKQELLKRLPALSNKKVELERAGGGLTNVVYIVKIEGQAEYIFKCFSEGYPSDLEQKVTPILSQKRIMPFIQFINKQYRIQHFVKQGRHPQQHQIVEQKLLKSILNKMQTIHQLDLQFQPNQHQVISHKIFGQEQHQSIIKLKQKKVSDKQYEQLLNKILNVLEKREYWKKFLLPQNGKLVICHNDLNNLNIMQTPKQVFLIDYDYVSFNYPGFDIANLINETSFDYSVPQSPGFKIIKTYTPSELQGIVKHYPKYYPELTGEVLKFLCVVNLFWAIWSIQRYQLNVSAVFSMLEHGLKRIELFELYQGMIDKN